MRQIQKNHRNKGAILSLMVLVILLLSMTSVALLRVGGDARIRSVKSDGQISARFAADAGIERAIYIMNEELNDGAWTLDDIPTYTSESLIAANANYTVTYTGDLTNGYQITSVGTSRGQTKTVRVTVELTSPIADDFAILAKDGLIAKSKSTIDGYNSGDPSDTDVKVKIGTQSTDDNAIDIKKNTDINADVYIGPDGDPDEVIKSADQLNINGEVFVMPTEYYFPEVTAPSYTASQGSISGNNVTLTSSDSGKYDDISISNNGTLSINGDLTLYVTGDVDLRNNAELEIENNSTLTLYLDGDLDAQNSSGFNNTTEVPSNLTIYGTGTDQQFNIKNSSDLYAVIYAPNADMTVHNSVSAYGSFIVDNFELKNGGEVYYDEALKQVDQDDPLVRFTVTRWEEL